MNLTLRDINSQTNFGNLVGSVLIQTYKMGIKNLVVAATIFLFLLCAIIKKSKGVYMPLLIILFILAIIMAPGIRIIHQYERGVIFTLGKYTGMRNPGLRIIIPYIQTITRVDIRTTPIDVSKQEVITKDNVTVGVDAIVYFRVLDPSKALLETTNYVYATTNFAQAALRDVTGGFELDELLSKRDEISDRLKEIVDKETDKWGIDIESVKLQNIELPNDMKRAMAKQAEAERERRAAIITAEGEKAAAQAVTEAAALLAKTPGAMQIRTLQTLEKISQEPSQNTVLVLPSDYNGGISVAAK